MIGFRDAGVVPRYVQIGNEISDGMLWDDGRVGGEFDTWTQWQNLTTLLSAAKSGVLDSLPPEQQPRIVIHTDKGGDNAACRWFFDHLSEHGFDFSTIGLSYYPWWQGSLSDLQTNLADLANRYQREILLVETAYPWTLGWNDNTGNVVGLASQLLPGYPATPEGQAAFLRDLRGIVQSVPYGLGRGAFYWEPAWISTASFGSSWENVAMFDFAGNAEPGLDSLRASAVGDHRESSVPAAFEFTPMYPNPFNGVCEGEIEMAQGRLSVEVFDVLGRRVRTLEPTESERGRYRVRFDGAGLSSGVYLIAASTEKRGTQRQKVLLVR
jgi:arabinogalactan endo-1,4-beta-galactosidase